jgi:cytochrome c oxidase assembly protein subunit 15
MPSPAFRRLCLLGALVAICVIVLGGWVRLSDAGLGCPDWPGCYGHLTVGEAVQNSQAANASFPERPLEADKALKEMIHRYLAASLGLLILGVAGFALWNRDDPAQPRRLPAFLVILVIFQGLLGMWTVTLLLKPAIVVAHLAGGLTTMALLWWLSLRGEQPVPAPDARMRRWSVLALGVLVAQILLGGWVSSNYSALACPDFPSCQNSYWPSMQFKDAFVLWRGLGIDYEGGVLDHPARVAIHFTHRLGAIVAALVLGWTAWLAARNGRSRRLRVAGLALGALLLVQLVLGPTMVLKTLPLALATAHNGVAALLLAATVAVLRYSHPPAAGRRA